MRALPEARAVTKVLLLSKCNYPFVIVAKKLYLRPSYSGQFVIIVSCIAILFAIVFFVVGITTAYKGKAAQTVTFAVSILVAFVPEGLP